MDKRTSEMIDEFYSAEERFDREEAEIEARYEKGCVITDEYQWDYSFIADRTMEISF